MRERQGEEEIWRERERERYRRREKDTDGERKLRRVGGREERERPWHQHYSETVAPTLLEGSGKTYTSTSSFKSSSTSASVLGCQAGIPKIETR